MISPKLLLLSIFFLHYSFQGNSQTVEGTIIPLTHITTIPADISQRGSGPEKLADRGYNAEEEIFHTLWAGIAKQTITIEAALNGKGKRLDKIIVSPRKDGENGIIKTAELWIMVKGKYQKISDIEYPSDQLHIASLN